MVNVTYDASGTMIAWTETDGEMVANVYNNGDMAFMIISAVLVMIMSPGVGLLYSGLLRRKNALSMMALGLAVYSVATVQWFFWGYSLAFSDTANVFIGNLKHFGLMNVDVAPSQGSAKIPALLFALYQGMFCAITNVIWIAGCAERARILPILVFAFVWSTIVYAPIANWDWNSTGWAYKLGVLDFAGGGPVHMTSGTATLAWSVYLGKRKGYGSTKLAYRPHSVSHVIIGTVLIWFGWFGFNGGSELAMNMRSIQASVATNVAASMGGVTWLVMDFFYTGKWSAVSMCSGILAGLVGITPAAGFVGTPASLAIGFLTAIGCNYGTAIKVFLQVDDAVDGFALHALGGFIGALLTGIFADSRVAGFDGFTEISGGWINKNYIQLGYQLAAAVAIIGWTFVVSYLILFVLDKIPGLHLRANEESEILGIDETEMGEVAYDFVSLGADIEDPEGHQAIMDKLRAGHSANHSANQSEEKIANAV